MRLPVAVWREAMDAHFPGQAWLRLTASTYDRLAVYRGTSRPRRLGRHASRRLLEEADG